MKAVALIFAVSMARAHVSYAAQSADPSADSDYFQRSYDQEAAGHDQEALDALDKLSPGRKGSYVAVLRKGWLRYRLGRNAAAAEDYNKAIAMAPKAVEPRLGILLPLLADRQWALVERHARDVLKLDPENYLATLRLAFALFSENKLMEAQPLYRKLVEGYPSDTEARVGLGWTLLKLQRSKEAGAVFKAVLEFAPKNRLAQQGWAATAQ